MKPLTILNILPCYNSLDIMPHVLEYDRKEGIDSFVLDNYSNDGSWEYLQDNKIPSKRFDTGGAFYTSKIQEAKSKVIHELQPDWVIRGASDHFILTPGPLRATIEQADKEGYNAIFMPIGRVWNTGEPPNGDPRKIYFYYSFDKYTIKSLVGIHKSAGFESYSCEWTHMVDTKPSPLEGALLLDYGNTRGKEKRDEEYRRRQLAWQRGENKGHGKHYKPGSERGWVWNKEEFSDIRQSKYWPMIQDRFWGIA